MFPYLYRRINTDVALQQTCNLQKAYMIKLGTIGTHHETYNLGEQMKIILCLVFVKTLRLEK